MNKPDKDNSEACGIKCNSENSYQLTLNDFFNFADRLENSNLLLGLRNRQNADGQRPIKAGMSGESCWL